jgi:hypothetical protein
MSTPPSASASDPIHIVEVATPAQRRQFICFQWEVYKNDPHWVPPLINERMAFFDKSKNPFFEHSDAALFMAHRGGKVVGTIAAIINTRHNEQHHEKTGFFGAFEVIDDYAVAQKLFDVARDWVRARGMDTLRGPATLCINDECGMLTEGFDMEPGVLMTYNPRYYPTFCERYGFAKSMDLLAWWGDTEVSREVVKGKWKRVVELAEKRGRFTVRNIDFSKFDEEVEKIKPVYRRAWQNNWGNVSMTDHEIEHLGKNLKQIADPDLVYLAEVKGEVVGICVSLPNVNQALRLANPNPRTPEFITLAKFFWHWKIRKRVNVMRFLLCGVLPEHRASGMDAVMIIKTFETMVRKGFVGGECSWILESNDAMNRVIAEGGTRIYKKYRMYDLKI